MRCVDCHGRWAERDFVRKWRSKCSVELLSGTCVEGLRGSLVKWSQWRFEFISLCLRIMPIRDMCADVFSARTFWRLCWLTVRDNLLLRFLILIASLHGAEGWWYTAYWLKWSLPSCGPQTVSGPQNHFSSSHSVL